MQAVLSSPVLLPVSSGVWSEQRADDGKVYYWNKYQNMSKWTLTDEEKQHLVPNLDAYDNRLFMPLKDFMKHPIATELLHNGELMQVRHAHEGSSGLCCRQMACREADKACYSPAVNAEMHSEAKCYTVAVWVLNSPALHVWSVQQCKAFAVCFSVCGTLCMHHSAALNVVYRAIAGAGLDQLQPLGEGG